MRLSGCDRGEKTVNERVGSLMRSDDVRADDLGEFGDGMDVPVQCITSQHMRSLPYERLPEGVPDDRLFDTGMHLGVSTSGSAADAGHEDMPSVPCSPP